MCTIFGASVISKGVARLLHLPFGALIRSPRHCAHTQYFAVGIVAERNAIFLPMLEIFSNFPQLLLSTFVCLII